MVDADELTHETITECVTDEAWFDDDISDEYMDEIHQEIDTVVQDVECPVCGREYAYVWRPSGLVYHGAEGDELIEEY